MSPHKFIANYTLASGREWINHIVTIGASGCLERIDALSAELAATRYVPGMLVLVPVAKAEAAMQVARQAQNRDELIEALAPFSASVGDAPVAVIERDFAEGTTCRLL